MRNSSMKNNVVYVDFSGSNKKENSLFAFLLEKFYQFFSISRKPHKLKPEASNHKHIL